MAVLFRVFIITLALWTGAGVYTSIAEHVGWYSDPVGWVRNSKPQAGAVNPWPLMTAALGLVTLITLLGMFAYRGDGRRTAFATLAGTIVVLAATGLYFVPQLMLIFSRTESLNDAQLIAASRAWVIWNAVRIVFLLGLLYYGLVALSRMAAPGTRT